MKNILYNLSEKIDPVVAEVLQIIDQEASSRGLLYFVVGATARDILLHHCHDIRCNRLTRDLDIGVEVSGWDEFSRLSEALVATGRFTATREAFREVGETNWRAAEPVLRDELPRESFTLAYSRMKWVPEELKTVEDVQHV